MDHMPPLRANAAVSGQALATTSDLRRAAVSQLKIGHCPERKLASSEVKVGAHAIKKGPVQEDMLQARAAFLVGVHDRIPGLQGR